MMLADAGIAGFFGCALLPRRVSLMAFLTFLILNGLLRQSSCRLAHTATSTANAKASFFPRLSYNARLAGVSSCWGYAAAAGPTFACLVNSTILARYTA